MTMTALLGLVWTVTKILCTLALTWRGLGVLREMRLELVKRREMNYQIGCAVFHYCEGHGARGGRGP